MTRGSLDKFYTQPKLARAIVERLIREGMLDPADCVDVLEPSSGRGAFVHAVLDACPGAMVTAVDLDPEARRSAMRNDDGPAGQVHFILADFLDLSAHMVRGVDLGPESYVGEYRLIIGNPPFAIPVEGRKVPKPVALEHVLAALPLLEPVSTENPNGGRLVFLLRQSFAASRERWDRLFKRHRPHRIWQLVGRPSFTANGRTDQHEYAVYVLGPEGATSTHFDWLDWKA